MSDNAASDASAAPRIPLARPLEEVRAEAEAASPPREEKPDAPSDLVDLKAALPEAYFDIRYATSNNVLGAPLYDAARAFVQRTVAEALTAVQQDLQPHDLSLLIWDGYRPWYVTKWMWEATPKRFHRYLADPSDGSSHNRGCAVDCTLCDRNSGRLLPMPTAFDDFSERAHTDWDGASPEEKHNRDRLRHAMERHGFEVNPLEWWHYEFAGCNERFSILNVPLTSLDAAN